VCDHTQEAQAEGVAEMKLMGLIGGAIGAMFIVLLLVVTVSQAPGKISEEADSSEERYKVISQFENEKPWSYAYFGASRPVISE
jgi:hypothetical protein